MKKQFIRFAAVMLVFGAVASCAPHEKHQPEIIQKVKVANPVKDSEIASREFSGMIREAAEVNLAFRVAGPLEAIYVKEGDYVRQGQLIARIDPRDYEIQAGVYRAQYQQVKAEYDRLAELNSRKSVADNDYEKAVASEKMLRMKLQNAEDQLNDTRLTAPFSGYIQSVKYSPGEMVNTGMSVTTLLDVKSLLVEVDLPMSVFVRKADFTGFSCSQPKVSDSVYSLQLAGYQMKANNSQLYRATLRLDPKLNPGFAPGMNVNVLIDYRSGDNNPLSVPISAVFNEDGKTYIWKFHTSSSTVQKQPVITNGLSGNGMVRIVDGLNVEDEIVVAGVQSLRDGQKVERMKPASETNVGGLL